MLVHALVLVLVLVIGLVLVPVLVMGLVLVLVRCGVRYPDMERYQDIADRKVSGHR